MITYWEKERSMPVDSETRPPVPKTAKRKKKNDDQEVEDRGDRPKVKETTLWLEKKNPA